MKAKTICNIVKVVAVLKIKSVANQLSWWPDKRQKIEIWRLNHFLVSRQWMVGSTPVVTLGSLFFGCPNCTYSSTISVCPPDACL